MPTQKFSGRARIVFQQAKSRIRQRWPTLYSLTVKHLASAALASGFTVEKASLPDNAGDALKFSCDVGAFYIPVNQSREKKTEWPVSVELIVAPTGQYLQFEPRYELNIAIDQSEFREGLVDKFFDSLNRFMNRLAATHAPALALTRVEIDEPLEAEHTADGIVWHCAHELAD